LAIFATGFYFDGQESAIVSVDKINFRIIFPLIKEFARELHELCSHRQFKNPPALLLVVKYLWPLGHGVESRAGAEDFWARGAGDYPFAEYFPNGCSRNAPANSSMYVFDQICVPLVLQLSKQQGVADFLGRIAATGLHRERSVPISYLHPPGLKGPKASVCSDS
jgi:hypothetical protein